jgi:hypothetical protein
MKPKRQFNPAPGWPRPPADWTPPPGWQPDPSWPAAPAGWQFWVDVHPQPRTPEPLPPGVLWQSTGRPVTGLNPGRYRMTDEFLYFERGTLRTNAQQVPIAHVLDVDVKQSMTQKARGVGDVVVHIQRQGRIEIVRMEDLADYREAQQAINKAALAGRISLERRKNTVLYEGAYPVHTSPSAPEQRDELEQLKRLGELHDAGILTDEEFASKKAEILKRM